MSEQLKIIISAEVSKFKQGVEDAKQKINSFKDQVAKASENTDANIKKLGHGIAVAAAAIAAAVAAAATAMYKLVTSSAATCDEIDKMSQKIGISRQAYQEWDHICTQSGVDVNIFQNGMKSLTTAMDNANSGTQSAIDAFDALGLSWLDGAGNLKTQEQMMEETIAALASMEDGTERARLSQELFGRAGTELAPILNSGVEGIEALRGEAHELGLVLSDEAVANGVAFTDTMANVKNALAGVGNRIATELMPIFQQWLEKVIEVMPQIEEAINNAFTKIEEAFNFIQEHQGLFTALAVAIGVVVTAIGLYNAVAAVQEVLNNAHVTSIWALVAAHAAQAVAAAAALLPYIAIVAAIAAVIAIIVLCVKHWDEIKEAVAKAWNWIKEKTQEAVQKVVEWFENMKAKIQEKIEAAKQIISNVFNAIKAVIQSYLETCKTIVTSIFDGIKTAIQTRIETAKTIISNIVAAIKAIFTGDFGAAKTAVLNIFDAIKSGIQTRIENAKNTVKNVIDAIKGFFNFSWSLPTLKLPHVSITGKFSLDPPSVPKFSISWYAKGGVFDNPMLFGYGNGMLGGLGENGAEAVVPLENNLGWLDKLATMLNERMGSNQPIVLQVDGKTFAETSISTLNAHTRQTGTLGLILT